jgi:hypothetical protein
MHSSVAERPLGFSIDDLAERWGMSPFTIRRLIDGDHLRTITIGARRLIPAEEVRRAEVEGCGAPRKRTRSKKAT